MKTNIIYLVFVVTLSTNCKKDNTATTNSTVAPTSADIATRVSGLYIGTGSVINYNDISAPALTPTKIQLTKVTTTKVQVSSPEGFFPPFESGTLTESQGGVVSGSQAVVYITNGITLGLNKNPSTAHNYKVTFQGDK